MYNLEQVPNNRAVVLVKKGLWTKTKEYLSARCTKINAWNLVFCISFGLGLFVTASCSYKKTMLLITFVVMPYVIKNMQKIIYLKTKDIFIMPDGVMIKTVDMPSISCARLPFLGVGFLLLMGNTIAVNNVILDWIIDCSAIFGPLVSIFFLKNIPITVLFTKSFWTSQVNDTNTSCNVSNNSSFSYSRSLSYSSSSSSSSSSSYASSSNPLTSPSYSSMSGNIYNR